MITITGFSKDEKAKVAELLRQVADELERERVTITELSVDYGTQAVFDTDNRVVTYDYDGKVSVKVDWFNPERVGRL